MANTARRLNYFFQVMDQLAGELFSISGERDFNAAALQVFRYQAVHNPVYAKWINELGIDFRGVESIVDIPFLPVRAFSGHRVLAEGREPEKIFVSSGTAGMTRSFHYVADTSIYERSFSSCFRLFYGDPSAYVILALLPSYLEREGSSLVYMAGKLIEMSASPRGGFFLDDYRALQKSIDEASRTGRKIILLGVSFALLDFAEKCNASLENHIVMETGGMKGRRQEMTREELHSILCERFGTVSIHSEYGMTELLSQAYSKKGGVFSTPPWMKVLIRDPHDPFAYLPHGRSGGINIIDLANIYSCSFIETSDLGRSYPGGTFEILGRFDNSDIRGCNLLV